MRVAITFRGSVLFICSESKFFLSVAKFWYLYRVGLDRSKTLFYRWKMCCDHFWQWKNAKNKIESLRYWFCWYLLYFSCMTEGFGLITKSLNVNDSSLKQGAMWSPWRDVTNLITLGHTVITSCSKCQVQCVSSCLWQMQSQVIYCIGTDLMLSNGDFKGPGAFKIACRIILQLNVISLYSEWVLKSAFTHMSTDTQEYRILCYPLRTNWLVALWGVPYSYGSASTRPYSTGSDFIMKKW